MAKKKKYKKKKKKKNTKKKKKNKNKKNFFFFFFLRARASVFSYVAFVLSLFFSYVSFFWCLRKLCFVIVASSWCLDTCCFRVVPSNLFALCIGTKVQEVFIRFFSISFNPFMPIGFVHLNSLNRSIFSKRGVWLVFIIIMLYRNSCT